MAPATTRGSSPRRARPPVPPTVGVDIGGTTTSVALVGAHGEVLASERRATRPERGAEAVIEEIASVIRDLAAARELLPAAIGVGVAAQVDREGTVVAAPNLRWSSVPLARRLGRATRRPVVVTNDVRAATYGEWRFGAGRGARDLLCVFVGTGVGGGIVADGRIRFGATETAGEIGHMVIVHGGRRCRCPGRGCLEAYVGGWAIGARAQEAARKEPRRAAALLRLAGRRSRITARTVSLAAGRKDPLAGEILADTVGYLTSGLVGLVNIVNPRIVILGGGVVEGIPGLLPRLRAGVDRSALAAATEGLTLLRARLGGDAGMIGAAALARGGVPWRS